MRCSVSMMPSAALRARLPGMALRVGHARIHARGRVEEKHPQQRDRFCDVAIFTRDLVGGGEGGGRGVAQLA